MRVLFCTIAMFALCSFTTTWHYNLDEAESIAAKDHKYILLNFSGSDWCGPCVRMHKEIFDDPYFQQFSDTALIMVNADFPRNKKNQLSKEQQALNDKMADQYNNQGAFPYTVLLDANGKVLKSWNGFPKTDIGTFIDEIRGAMHAGN